MNKMTHTERLILIGLIVDPAFSAKAYPTLKEKHFSVPFTATVFNWCKEYYDEYNRPPGRTIQEIFRTIEESKTESEDLLELIKTFLTSIAKEQEEDAEKIDSDYLCTHLSEFVKTRDLAEVQESLNIALQNDDLEEAETVVAQYSTVSLSDIEFLQLGSMSEKIAGIIKESFQSVNEQGLIQLPGDLGKLLGPMQRGDLVAVAAPAKRGKSWWMQELALLATEQGKNVIMFSLEMSHKQVVSRIASRLTATSRYPKTFKAPYFEGEFIRHEQIHVTKPLSIWKLEAVSRVFSRMKRNGGDLIIQAYPAYSAKVRDLKSFINYMESSSGFIPDVILVDYADIIAPDYKGDYRHQIDHIWKMLRSLAQEKEALVITATHTNKNTFKKNIGQGDLSEESRKINHVACMFGLNQSSKEKESGIMRVNVIASRHDGFSPDTEAVVLQNLAIGNPMVDCLMKDDVQNLEEFSDK